MHESFHMSPDDVDPPFVSRSRLLYRASVNEVCCVGPGISRGKLSISQDLNRRPWPLTCSCGGVGEERREGINSGGRIHGDMRQALWYNVMQDESTERLAGQISDKTGQGEWDLAAVPKDLISRALSTCSAITLTSQAYGMKTSQVK